MSEISMLEQKINRVEANLSNCQDGEMKQKCIEKTIDIFDDKIKSHQENTDLRIENMIYKLKEEIGIIISKAIAKANSENKDKFRWGIEAIRVFIYIVSFVVGLIAVKQVGL